MPSTEKGYCVARIAGQHNINADSDQSFYFNEDPDHAILQTLHHFELTRRHCECPWSSTALHLASDAPRMFNKVRIWILVKLAQKMRVGI